MVNLDYIELTIDFFATIQYKFNQVVCNALFNQKLSNLIWNYYNQQAFNNEMRLYNYLTPAECQALLDWYNQQEPDNKLTTADVEAALPFFKYIGTHMTKLCKKVWPQTVSPLAKPLEVGSGIEDSNPKCSRRLHLGSGAPRPNNHTYHITQWTTQYQQKSWDFYQNCDQVAKSQIDMFYRTNRIKTSVTIDKF